LTNIEIDKYEVRNYFRVITPD